MRRASAAAVPILAAAGLVGCGGSAPPAERPETALARLVRFELGGRLGSSWAMLVREQRAEIDRGFYASCRPGETHRGVEVAVLGVSDEEYEVPAIGRTKTTAVSYRISLPQPGGDPLVVSDVAHLVAQDGKWRWTLSAKSWDRYRNGVCP